jgi:hypothetical protein
VQQAEAASTLITILEIANAKLQICAHTRRTAALDQLPLPGAAAIDRFTLGVLPLTLLLLLLLLSLLLLLEATPAAHHHAEGCQAS